MVNVPCKKNCVCGPFHNAGKINYPLWWYGQQGILYNFAGGNVTPSGCTFKDRGYWFDGNDDYLIDEHGRKILEDGTTGLWSSVNLDCTDPPPCGSVTGTGTKLYVNTSGTAPKITGTLTLCPKCCPNITRLLCHDNSISELNVSDLSTLTLLYCQDNSLSVLDVSTLTSLQAVSCRDNSLSVLDLNALVNLTSVYCRNNSISLLDTSNSASLSYVDCRNNSMNQAMVDTILCDMDGHGTNNGTILISSNAVPSAAGIACKNNLVGRGWTVTTD